MSHLPPPSSDRPSRSIPEAIDELIASIDRLRGGWQQTRDKLTVDLQRSDRVLGYLRKAAEASRGELPNGNRAEAARRTYVACPDCGRRGSAQRASHRCVTCEARAAE